MSSSKPSGRVRRGLKAVGNVVRTRVQRTVKRLKVRYDRQLTHEEMALARGEFMPKTKAPLLELSPGDSPFSVREEKEYGQDRNGGYRVVIKKFVRREAGGAFTTQPAEIYLGTTVRTYDAEGRLKTVSKVNPRGKTKTKLYSPPGRFIGTRIKPGK